MKKDSFTNPLVSVSILSYNHVGRISTAIESVLKQEVTFPIEIIIGDDRSTDDTQSIIEEYKNQYPELIKAIYHDKRYEAIPGRINNVTNLRACRGKYIAMLDGDDYWTHPNKLQRQVDFLESKPDFGISFHDVLMAFETKPELNGPYSKLHYSLRGLLSKKESTEFEFKDIFKYGGSCMATSSMVFRREKVLPLPEWFFQVAAADYSLQLLASRDAKIKYFPEQWGVYTRHQDSISNTYFRSIENLENKLNEFEIYKNIFRENYKSSYFKRTKSNIQFRLGKKYLKRKELWKGMSHIAKSVKTDPGHSFGRVYRFLGF